ncbi:hypothetical protein [Candidatus Reidiella endopervernicosa]|uniref:hypothetical protein n=1 Tax=Candidatus Reidiella endopervernicosa TaxID=2738883 RepID=UPI0026999146|nr:hypothetical protein [Candidatus Reidiella endopervernicosa]
MSPEYLRSKITPALCFVFLIAHSITPLYAAERPALMLANSYRQGNDVSAYWVSEKLDGVRAYWSGSELISRGGNRFQAPSWFTVDFPATPLDGELWMGRGRFGTLSGAVRRYVPNEEEWREIRFMVFDLPSATGSFDDRLKALKGVVSTTASAYIVLVEQWRVASESELM